MNTSTGCTTTSQDQSVERGGPCGTVSTGGVWVGLQWYRKLQHGLVFAVLALVVLLCGPGYGQNISADVLGAITDASGAVVPNATVTIKDLGTNASRTVQTNGSGEYIFSLLPVGNYSLSVEATGFGPQKTTGFAASAGDRLRMNIKLEVGASNQVIEVQTNAELIQTDTSSVGSTVAQKTIEDVPLNGRNLTNLITLQAGVTAGLASATDNGSRYNDRRQTSEVDANGQSEYFNNNIIDGIDNNERDYNLVGVKPSIEGVQEVQVLTDNFPADIGRSAGAAISVITKAGTNDFHGSLYEFFRNDIFDAKQYFTPVGTRNQEWRQNQFGGSIGGPIRKNKDFFFFDMEEFRLVQGINSPQQIVPTDAARAFVASSPMADPIGKRLFDLYPEPNITLPGSPVPNAYVSAPNLTQNFTTIDARVDEQLSPKDQLFARYNYSPTTAFFPNFFPTCGTPGNNCNGDASDVGIDPVGAGFISFGQFPGTNTTSTQGAQLNYSHVFSPHLLMELRTGFLRINIATEPIDIGTNDGTKLGIGNSNIAGDPRATGMPNFHMQDGSADLGDATNIPLLNTGNNFQWNGDIIYTRGEHNIKIGAALIRRQLNYLQELEPEGWFYEAAPGSVGSYPTTFGGLPATSQLYMALGYAPFLDLRQNMFQRIYLRSFEPSAYVQDDWHVRPGLTLNLGVRYDIFTPLSESKGRYSNFDLNTLTFINGGTAGLQTKYGNVAPRLGFAAQLHPGLVLHGGFGMVYYPGDFGNAISLFNLPYSSGISCLPVFHGCPAGTGTLAQGAPLPPTTTAAITNPAYANSLAVNAKQLNFRASYLEQFNLFLQQQVGANSFTLGYVGSLGRRQIGSAGFQANFPTPNANGVINLVNGAVPRYYGTQLPGVGQIQYYEDEGTSNYNAMQVVFTRRVASGLTVNANYTWSHGLNNWSGYETNGPPPEWRFNYAYDYGNSDLDVTNRFAYTAVYAFPNSHALKGFSGGVLNGWSVSASGYAQSGLPFTVVNSKKPSGAFGDVTQGLRTNTPSGSFYAPNKSINQYLNNSWKNVPATLTATTYMLGNEGMNQLRGPHTRQFDVATFKTIPVKGELKAQFRAECYNLSNTPNFTYPSNDIAATNFGQITSTTYGLFPRVFQFAVKLQF